MFGGGRGGAYPGWSSLDGSLNAPSGSAQYPSLLDASSGTNGLGRNLATRPPWKVAGVDYHVGIDRSLYPNNSNLLDPSIASLPSGVTFSSPFVIVASATAVVLDGYDFGLHNGMTIFLRGTANGGGGSLTVSNCNFLIGSNNNSCISTDNAADVGALTIINCELDGGGAIGSTGGPLMTSNSTIITVKYNYWHNAVEDGFDPGTAIGQHQTIVMMYNLFDTAGFGSGSPHPDWLQINNANNGLTNGQGITDRVTCNFNTSFQSNAAGFNMQSVFRLNTQVNAAELAYNTCVCGSTGQSNTYFDIVEASGAPPGGDDPCTIINPQLHDNYVLQDNFTHPWTNGLYSTFPTPAYGIVNPSESNNIDMFAGTALPVI